MSKFNLSTMSVDSLLKLQKDVANTLSRRANQLRDELSKLTDHSTKAAGRSSSSLKGRKVAIKYRDRQGNTWAGRGVQPRWLREKLKAGAKLEQFAVEKSAKTRRRKK
jgi:DNA-binding protein H-NS